MQQIGQATAVQRAPALSGITLTPAWGFVGSGGALVMGRLTGVFASRRPGGFQNIDIATSAFIPLKSVAFTIGYCAVVTLLVLYVMRWLTRGRRVADRNAGAGSRSAR